MMYYLYSLVISIVIFIIMEWRKARSNTESDDPYEFNIKSVGNLLIIYIFITLIYYCMNMMSNNSTIGSPTMAEEFTKVKKMKGGEMNEMMEYNILKKIPEDVNIGFGFTTQ